MAAEDDWHTSTATDGSFLHTPLLCLQFLEAVFTQEKLMKKAQNV